jgi:hypothetical protein
VLAGKGVTAWQRTVASLAPADPANRAGSPAGPPPASGAPPLPAGLAAELISVLAALALPAPDPAPTTIRSSP